MTPVAPTLLCSAPWVLPIVAPPLREGAVALTADGTIVAVGPRDELRARFADLPERRADGVMLPALVNAHTHLELSALGGQPTTVAATGFLAWAAGTVERNQTLTPVARAAAARAGALDLKRHGVTAVGDVGNGLSGVPALGAAGLRGLFFHELLGSREQRTGDALADAARERAAFTQDQAWPDGLAAVPAPHAPYSVGPTLFRNIFAAATAARLPTSVHVAEDADEIALLREGRGRWPDALRAMGVDPAPRVPHLGPLAYLETLGAFAGPCPPLLVHMVFADDEDRAIARRHQAPVVLCPRSNLAVSGRLPDLPRLFAAGLGLAIGTDSLASAASLSPWADLHVLRTAFPDVPPAALLFAATRGGATALGLPAVGGVAPGLRPGLIAVALPPTTQPESAVLESPTPDVTWLHDPTPPA